jgi:predicted membrane chloride channel (bestrophin family)
MHLAILFQMYGSVWPKVLPYCLLNLAITATIQYLIVYKHIDLTISDQSHAFMNLLVSFLIVSRVTISVSRYNDARSYLEIICRETRELLQTMLVLTRRMQMPCDKEWRNETAYRALLLLQVVMAVVDYRSDKVPAWEIPELLGGEEAAELKRLLYMDFGDEQFSDTTRTEFAMTLRVPALMAYKLRCCIDSSSDRLSEKMDELRALKLYDSVDSFMGGYYAIRQFVTTPFPFPLVQMTRTFLFFYIFTVPFALLNDASSTYAYLVVVFFLTYGFIGIELVSNELEDPFGNDPNDFNNMAMASLAFDDTFLLIMQVDGKEYTDKLLARLQKTTKETTPHEEMWLLNQA